MCSVRTDARDAAVAIAHLHVVLTSVPQPLPHTTAALTSKYFVDRRQRRALLIAAGLGVRGLARRHIRNWVWWLRKESGVVSGNLGSQVGGHLYIWMETLRRQCPGV